MGAPAKDPRARRSRRALEHALLELVRTEDLAQISVSDITKHARVSRSTFYEHYVDVHDLAASACTDLFDELVAGLPLADPGLVDEAEPADNPLVPVYTHFGTHAELYRSLLGPDGSARVLSHLLDRLRVATTVNLRFAARSSARVTESPPGDPLHALIAGAIVGTAVGWLRGDAPGTPEELAARVWPRLLAAALAG
ncbi:TetR/AcrR family transcriptional regulator [Cryptosporangium arvum]|uniref:TetR/AcrR family transcriptional regulator n=1 Tax=Cryptosporangium arvum TaxID=80871 RepID=UPI00056729AC|nr:TetR/AcrR family transcriptional regulator [Cryptosporangium arvum]